MSDGVIVAIITAASSLLLAIVNAGIAAWQRRQSKKTGTKARLETIEQKLDRLTEHNEAQYLSILRLTIMAPEMPMSERLIAGKEYLSRGGNGDVKAYYHQLEKSIND